MTFGGSGLTEECYKRICELLPVPGHVLELGSGEISTRLLSRVHYVTSIEHDTDFLNRHPANYIHAPLHEGWYDRTVVTSVLKDLHPYQLLLIDGPTGSPGRIAFLLHRHLFNLSAIIVIDDTWRPLEHAMADFLSEELKRPVEHHSTFAVIPA